MNDGGISWLFGDYKGSGLKAAYLYGGSVPEADLTFDSYDEIGEKWSKPLATKNFTENKEVSSALKNAFKYGDITIEKPSMPPKFKVKFGSKRVYGK